jgi:hypothetical protein
MPDKKQSRKKKAETKEKGLTPTERTILKKSMIRHDKALKILSKL